MFAGRMLPLDQIQLVLSEPPEGVEIEDVISVPGGAAMILRVDGEKA